MLKTFHDEKNMFEIGVDECARGPMFGRLYTAAVVLPKQNFDFANMKDSKKIKSRTKMREISDYIKSNAIAWSIQYIEAKEIDEINIRQSVLKSMRSSLFNVVKQLQISKNEIESQIIAIVDGNDFPAYTLTVNDESVLLPHICVEKADNTYCFVAAASILAKCAHDEYIVNLCDKYPLLQTRYSLCDNVGYGTKKHMEGIQKYGITQWHRATYGCCKTAPKYVVEIQESETTDI